MNKLKFTKCAKSLLYPMNNRIEEVLKKKEISISNVCLLFYQIIYKRNKVKYN